MDIYCCTGRNRLTALFKIKNKMKNILKTLWVALKPIVAPVALLVAQDLLDNCKKKVEDAKKQNSIVINPQTQEVNNER